MKIDINENAKIVALWFTNQENPQENLPLDIEKEIEIYCIIKMYSLNTLLRRE